MKEKNRGRQKERRQTETAETSAQNIWNATASELPWYQGGGSFPVRLNSFVDHGIPCLQARIMETHPLFQSTYDTLSESEKARVESAFREEVERTLAGKPGMKSVVLSGYQKTHISVNRETIGRPANPDLIYWHGRRRMGDGTNVSFIIAASNARNASSIQRVLENAGYPKKV